MKKAIHVAKTALPCIFLLFGLILTDRYVFDIMGAVLLLFPLSFVLGGVLAARGRVELPFVLMLLSFIFLVFVNLRFNIGVGVGYILVYSLLGVMAFGAKHAIGHALQKRKTRGAKKPEKNFASPSRNR